MQELEDECSSVAQPKKGLSSIDEEPSEELRFCTQDLAAFLTQRAAADTNLGGSKKKVASSAQQRVALHRNSSALMPAIRHTAHQ